MFCNLINALTLSFLLLIKTTSPLSASISSNPVITSGVVLIVKPPLAKTTPPFLKINASVNSRNYICL